MAGKGSAPGERRGGRQKGTPNKSTADIKALAQVHGAEVIKGYYKMFRDSKVEDIRLRAGTELLNRGYGRSTQQTNLAGHDGGPLDLSLLSDEQLEAAIERIAAGVTERK